MTLANRMKHLRELLNIRVGPGAARLPPTVKRVHMDFAYKMQGGHFGPRKVWREYLPRLKYHNPSVSMSVNRTHDQEGPATMSIFFKGEGNTDESSERVETVAMKHKRTETILQEFMEKTGAEAIKATPAEEKALQYIEEHKVKSAADSARSKARLQEKRAEERERKAAIEA